MSKVFFRTHSVDLRVMDITKITSNVKSWLYADQLLKPEEFVMYRPASYGGLGVINVKMKAMAGLIKSFLETAGNEKFLPSLYHTLLFRFHVLDDTSVQDPGFPPFYSKEFFSSIRKVHHETPLNVFKMSEKEWYTFLLEDQVTKQVVDHGKEDFIMCRVERANLDTDWEQCWRLARLPGLGPENTSFMFRVLHQTLPTQERVARIKPGSSAKCKMEGCQADTDETLCHALIHCQANDGVGHRLLDRIRGVQPDLGAEAALRLELHVDAEHELPVVWVMATIFRCLWNLRQSTTKVKQYLIRSQLEAEINLLRETRYKDSVAKIEELTTNLLHID